MYIHGLNGPQRREGPLSDGLKLVVVQGEKVQVVQVLESIHPKAVDLVGIQ